MPIKSALLGTLIVIGYLFSFAQLEIVSDAEYRQSLLDANNRKERVAVLMQMPESFIEENAEEALGLTNELLERVRNDDGKLAKANLLQGIAYYNLDRYDEAEEQLVIANSYAHIENEKDKRLRADIEYYLGNVAGIQGSYLVAKNHGERALAFANELDDEELKTYILSELAIYEEELGNTDKAIEYHLKAYQIDIKRNDSSSIVADLNNLAHTYSERRDYLKALDYYKEATNYYTDSSQSNLKNIVMNNNNIANVLLRLNQPDSALIFLDKSLKISIDANLNYEQVFLLLNFANLEMRRGNYNLVQKNLIKIDSLIKVTKATKFLPNLKTLEIELNEKRGNFNKALNIANELLNNTSVELPVKLRLEILEKKSKIQSTLLDYKGAKNSLNEYILLKDEYVSEFSSKEFEKFRTVYELDKRDLEIANLNQQAELDKKNLKLTKAFRNVIIALFFLSLGFLLFLRNTFNQRRRIRQLEHEKEMNALNIEIATMQGKIAGLLDQQPEIATSNGLPLIEQINSALLDPLTEREYEILKAMEEGQSNKEIGAVLFISVNTVKYHLKNIYVKLDANNRVQALQKLRSI